MPMGRSAMLIPSPLQSYASVVMQLPNCCWLVSSCVAPHASIAGMQLSAPDYLGMP